jgi:hypothetical protein
MPPLWSLSYHETVRHTSSQRPQCPQHSLPREARSLGRYPRPVLQVGPVGGELVEGLQPCYNLLAQVEILTSAAKRMSSLEELLCVS